MEQELCTITLIVSLQTYFPARDVPFFIRTPPKDSQFLHKAGRIFKSKEPPKNEPFGNFSSKGAAKALRGRNPAIFRRGADEKWNDPTSITYKKNCCEGKVTEGVYASEIGAVLQRGLLPL